MSEELLHRRRTTGYDMVPYYINKPTGCFVFGHVWQEEEEDYVCSKCEMTYTFFNNNTQKNPRSNQ